MTCSTTSFVPTDMPEESLVMQPVSEVLHVTPEQ